MNEQTCVEHPPVSESPWRQRDGRTVLLASRIDGRDGLHFPPLPATSPLASSSEIVELGGTPVLYSFTIVHPGPRSSKAPVALGQVDYPEGLRIFGRIETPQGRRPVIGERLQPFLQQDVDGAIYAFRAQEEGSAP